MNHRLSKIKDKQIALDAIEYLPRRNLDKAQIQSLSQLNFIGAKQNIIITGKTGTGKMVLQKISLRGVARMCSAFGGPFERHTQK